MAARTELSERYYRGNVTKGYGTKNDEDDRNNAGNCKAGGIQEFGYEYINLSATHGFNNIADMWKRVTGID